MISLYNLLFENIEDNKKELINMLSSKIDESLDDDTKEVIDLITNNTDPVLVQQILKLMKTQGIEAVVNTQVMKLLKKSNSRNRFVNPKTQATSKLGSKTKINKKLDFDAKQAFKDLTEEHFRSKSTFKAIAKLVSLVAQSQVSDDVKNSFIDLLEDPKNLIPGSTFNKESATGNVDSFLSTTITTHPLYSEIKEDLMGSVGEKATGTGEYFLTIFGENGGLPKQEGESGNGDVFISGYDIEVKNGNSASAIDANIVANRIQMDVYNIKWLTSVGFSREEIKDNFESKGKAKSKATSLDFTNPLLKNKLSQSGGGEEKVKNYLKGIYTSEGDKGLDDSDVDKLTSEIYSNIGSGKKLDFAKIVAPYVFKLYKKNKGFDIYLLMDKKGNFTSTNSDILPKGIKILSWVLGQGGNNYPYKAYITVSM